MYALNEMINRKCTSALIAMRYIIENFSVYNILGDIIRDITLITK